MIFTDAQSNIVLQTARPATRVIHIGCLSSNTMLQQRRCTAHRAIKMSTLMMVCFAVFMIEMQDLTSLYPAPMNSDQILFYICTFFFFSPWLQSDILCTIFVITG